MIKRTIFLIIATFALSLTSCKKECVHCHRIKIYDNAEVGVFNILSIEEACGKIEQRKYTKQKSESSDANGNFKTFWVCGLYEDDFK